MTDNMKRYSAWTSPGYPVTTRVTPYSGYPLSTRPYFHACPECGTVEGNKRAPGCSAGADLGEGASQTDGAGDASKGNSLHDHMRETFARCLSISIAKNRDYASNADPFSNFCRAETVGVTVERGILVRLTDKLARISNLLDQDATVAGESLGDSIDDAVNYLAILRAWLATKD